jgi:hypothetical protein
LGSLTREKPCIRLRRLLGLFISVPRPSKLGSGHK